MWMPLIFMEWPHERSDQHPKYSNILSSAVTTKLESRCL